ncbi:hypothetical protein FHX49_000520 [Microbacterium endophyticum]|uniref:ScoMcrA-like SRA domain-containing protein n=1 Tax=Microbacterium endophyticum TaxID=1526412 RepID=A0A7W4YLY8_9MICO|nr:hypothetical protein [Microbacterium endophyticum]MBB2974979.1 hypothetical protein [Microbacterium endophyticum]NIK37276.1 hypothetical protein [Microbacterium endophyticum]
MADVTPANLSLELNVPQKRIRAFLRGIYGTLPTGVSRWQLDSGQVARVRAHFGGDGSATPSSWSLDPGDTVRRREIHSAYGGQQQGGISTPRSIPDVLIFTDPASGAKYGYDTFEGLREDGSYWYTGEGQYGPQEFVRGNRALRDAASEGKTIRLLRTNGVNATYIGAFTTGDPAYEIETIPDADGNPREGIIFNLLPLDARVELLPAYGGELKPPGGLVDYVADPRRWTPPDFADILIPQRESAQGDRVVSRVEFELQSDFGAWLTDANTPPYRLPLRAGSTIIEPDFYVPGREWIVEAKRSTARGYVRTAIGQVLDYVHIAAKAGLTALPVILLPGEPESDLVELMFSLNIIAVCRDHSSFRVLAD